MGGLGLICALQKGRFHSRAVGNPGRERLGRINKYEEAYKSGQHDQDQPEPHV